MFYKLWLCNSFTQVPIKRLTIVIFWLPEAQYINTLYAKPALRVLESLCVDFLFTSLKEPVSPVEEVGMDEWPPRDTILCVLILLFLSLIMFILAKIAWLYFHNWSINGKKKSSE